jgi:hypothetical protein
MPGTKAMNQTILTVTDFNQQVRKRDNYQCRWCEGSVEVGRVLSIYGSQLDTLHDVRAAILLCQHCYDVIARGDWCVRGLSYFEGQTGRQYIDATYRIVFEPAFR